MTAKILPETMAALRPYMEADELSDEKLREISSETGISFDELESARDALWSHTSGFRASEDS